MNSYRFTIWMCMSLSNHMNSYVRRKTSYFTIWINIFLPYEFICLSTDIWIHMSGHIIWIEDVIVCVQTTTHRNIILSNKRSTLYPPTPVVVSHPPLPPTSLPSYLIVVLCGPVLSTPTVVHVHHQTFRRFLTTVILLPLLFTVWLLCFLLLLLMMMLLLSSSSSSVVRHCVSPPSAYDDDDCLLCRGENTY
jgi:hypothetical protein